VSTVHYDVDKSFVRPGLGGLRGGLTVSGSHAPSTEYPKSTTATNALSTGATTAERWRFPTAQRKTQASETKTTQTWHVQGYR